MMKLYLLALANLLDELASNGEAFLTEGEYKLSVSDLGAKVTKEIYVLCKNLGWDCSIFDMESNAVLEEDINTDFEPFRLSITKPGRCSETLEILTLKGFLEWLESGHSKTRWRVAPLAKAFSTQGRLIMAWNDDLPFNTSEPLKSPRSLVKETGNIRSVESDIRPWLMLDGQQLDFSEKIHVCWAAKAAAILAACLSNEIDSENQSLVFKGPPKLILSICSFEKIQSEITFDFFQKIHSAAIWVYEESRQAEIRHNLLSSEFSRSGRENTSTIDYFKENIESALEGAKIAYQMSLSDLGKDTLKSLGDLRKAITEETAKSIDATRQVVAAVAAALAVGIGLVAARLSTDINPWLVIVIMTVTFGYVSMVAYSGWGFIKLQRDLRSEWRTKLYRFLPANEYKKMVEDPTSHAEKIFKISSFVGGIAVLVMGIAVSIFGFIHSATQVSPNSSVQNKIINYQSADESNFIDMHTKEASFYLKKNNNCPIILKNCLKQ